MVEEETSSQIHNLCRSWPVSQFKPVLEQQIFSASEDATSSNSLDSPTTSTSNTIRWSEQVFVAGTRRKQIGTTRTSVTRTFLGNICCSVTKHKVVKPWDVNTDIFDDENGDYDPGTYQREPYFRYTPSRQVVRFGVKALQMSTQGWQARLRVFKVLAVLSA